MQKVNITSIQHDYFVSKFYKLKSALNALIAIVKNPRFVLIVTNIENNQDEYDMEIIYSGITPTGAKAIISEFLKCENQMDDVVTDANDILNN